MIDSENKAYIDARINTLRNMINDLWNQIKRIDVELNNLKNNFNCIQSNSEDIGNAFKKFADLARSETNDTNRNLEQKDDLEIFDLIDKNYNFEDSDTWNNIFLSYCYEKVTEETNFDSDK